MLPKQIAISRSNLTFLMSNVLMLSRIKALPLRTAVSLSYLTFPLSNVFILSRIRVSPVRTAVSHFRSTKASL